MKCACFLDVFHWLLFFLTWIPIPGARHLDICHGAWGVVYVLMTFMTVIGRCCAAANEVHLLFMVVSRPESIFESHTWCCGDCICVNMGWNDCLVDSWGVPYLSTGSGHVIMVSANERRRYTCKVFSHWLRPLSHDLRKQKIVPE